MLCYYYSSLIIILLIVSDNASIVDIPPLTHINNAYKYYSF